MTIFMLRVSSREVGSESRNSEDANRIHSRELTAIQRDEQEKKSDALLLSHACGVNYHKTGAEWSKPSEVPDIEGQEILHPV
jgi:hypothetical protein